MVKKRGRSEVEKKIEDFAQGAIDEDTRVNHGLELEAFECEPWRLHNRSELWFDTERDIELSETIASVGQLQPGLVRENKGSGSQYEVIFGLRRWNACKTLGIKFKAEVLPADTSDAHCALLMEIENEKSENITEFEKALNYKRLIDAEVFENQGKLASEFGVSKQYVQKLVAASKLFDVDWLKALFGPLLLSVSVANASKLLKYLDNPKYEKRIKEAAELINPAEEKDAKLVFSALIDAAEPPKNVSKKVLGKEGKKVVASCIKDKTGAISIKFTPGDISAENRAKVRESVIKQVEQLLK